MLSLNCNIQFNDVLFRGHFHTRFITAGIKNLFLFSKMQVKSSDNDQEMVRKN